MALRRWSRVTGLPEWTRALNLRLFLILVTAFSFFWEGGYLIHAMHQQEGDMYFLSRWSLEPVTMWQRWFGAALGLALYLLSARLTARSLAALWPKASRARSVARTVWLSVALGAALAAAAYTGGVNGDFRDALLEIAVASFPMLLIPLRDRQSSDDLPTMTITRNVPVIVLALIVYGAFVMTLGRGLS